MTNATSPAPALLDLLPHRPPMLLIDELISVQADRAESLVRVNDGAAFFKTGFGVPSCIGLEYMGQTAALIAGYQLQQGLVEPHLGFLLGSRKYESTVDYFAPGAVLRVICSELAVVGDSLANFDCRIENVDDAVSLAAGVLSVYRKPLEEGTTNAEQSS